MFMSKEQALELLKKAQSQEELTEEEKSKLKLAFKNILKTVLKTPEEK